MTTRSVGSRKKLTINMPVGSPQTNAQLHGRAAISCRSAEQAFVVTSLSLYHGARLTRSTSGALTSYLRGSCESQSVCITSAAANDASLRTHSHLRCGVPFAWADTRRCRRSRTRSSLPFWALATSYNFHTRRRTGTHRWASSRSSDTRILDR